MTEVPASSASRRTSTSSLPESRGTKRSAEATPEDVRAQSSRRNSEQSVIPLGQSEQAEATTSSTTGTAAEASAVLTFCRQCGEQERAQNSDAPGLVCARCFSPETVDDPSLVLQWYDDVLETEAFDKYFGIPGSLQDNEPPDNDMHEHHEHSEFDSLQVADYVKRFPKRQQDDCKKRPNLGLLRRHGRSEALRRGWDGSPLEVQPMFENNNYLTIAHHWGDAPSEHDYMYDLDDPEDFECYMTSHMPRAVASTHYTEALSAKMLQERCFDFDTALQILHAVPLSATPNRSAAAQDNQGRSFVFGYYRHGGNVGVTRRTLEHPHFTRYLVAFMKHHGSGPISSIALNFNFKVQPHRDLNNAGDSWTISFGSFKGGQLWVDGDEAPRPSTTKIGYLKTPDDPRRPGYLLDSKETMVTFNPRLLHVVREWTGTRWAMTGYNLAALDQASDKVRQRLRDLGFHAEPHLSRSTCRTTSFVSHDRSAWNDLHVEQAYPTRVSGEPEHGVSMERSSDEEGDDGSREPAGRAAKQALKKELPWQAMREDEVPAFVQAVVDEWSEWTKWSSCRPVWLDLKKLDPSLILKSRICYRYKPKDDGTTRAKARIVIAGFRDPHLPLLSRDSPVLSRGGLLLLLQWAASHAADLHNGDCKSAFLQGKADDERPTSIFMRPPDDPVAKQAVPEWRDRQLLYKLSAPVYGQANAPRRWFLYVVDVLTELNWVQHSLDPCLFMMKIDGQIVALLGLHVDDVIAAALANYTACLQGVRNSFVWGSPWKTRDFTFVGRRIVQNPDNSITVDQEAYVKEIATTKIKLPLEEKLANHPELITEFRSGIGSLQWLSGTTRGDIAADTSLLQRSPSELTVGDLHEINATLRYVRATPNAFVKINSIPIPELIFVCYGDSGWANAPGNKSQGGLVITATSKGALKAPQVASLLDWKSYRHQRVLRSTLAAEAASLDKAEDAGNYLAAMFSEMTNVEYRASTSGRPLFDVIPVTDARSLWDAIHRLTTSFAEKRVEIDIAALRQNCRGLRWVPTEKQLADALTKRSKLLRDAFRLWMQNPIVALTDSKSPEDVLPSENKAWRGAQPV